MKTNQKPWFFEQTGAICRSWAIRGMLLLGLLACAAPDARAGVVDDEDENVAPTALAAEAYVPRRMAMEAGPGMAADSGFRIATSGADAVIVHPIAERFPDITLKVTVLDASGNAVEGLTESSFQVWEKAPNEPVPVAQTIDRFEEDDGDMGGISFSLVFDVSGSMAGQRLADAKEAARQFVNQCLPLDRGALVKFSSASNVEVVYASDWVTTDSNENGVPDIVEAIDALVASGLTALYDGTAMGIDSLSQEPQPKAVIVFTDGMSNNDALYSINTVIQKAVNEGVPLYTIGLGLDPDNLRQMATDTGGRYYFAPTANDMAAIYEDIARHLRSRYTIAYTTHNPAYDGQLRTVTVTETNAPATGTGIYTPNARPVITLDPVTVQLEDASQPANIPLTISGQISDQDAVPLQQTVTATLHYRVAGASAFSSVNLALTHQGAGVYTFSGTIPAGSVQPSAVQYYIRASDGLLETFEPYNHQQLPRSIPVLPNRAPVIVHTPVTASGLGADISIGAEITDPDLADSVAMARVYYRPRDYAQTMPYRIIAMQRIDGDTFTGIIPGADMTLAGIEYFISAWDQGGARADHGTAGNPHFIQAGSSLRVTIEPALARADGAQWRVDGGDWRNSGVTLGMDPGTYTVEFKNIPGWVTPVDQTVTVRDDETTHVIGVYVEHGTLQVTIEPAAARAAGAQWRMDGGAWRNSEETIRMEAGTYTVSFKSIPGWVTPVDQTVTVHAAQITICEVDYVLIVPPNVTTAPISDVSIAGTLGGGTVTADGGASVTSRGVVWSTNPNPTIDDDRTIDGVGTGSFSSTLDGLRTNTTYYVRAYAINSAGIGYGGEVSFKSSIVLSDYDPVLNGTVHVVALQPDGRVLVGGAFTAIDDQTRNRMARINSDGSLDDTFNPNIDGASVDSIALLPDGKILVGGWFGHVGGQRRDCLAKLNQDGTLDASLNIYVNSSVLSLAVQPDGAVLLGGAFVSVDYQTRHYIARLLPDGTLDAGFNPQANEVVKAIALQSDGGILVGGYFTSIGGHPRDFFARFHADGSLDTGFDAQVNGPVETIQVQADGAILIGGRFTAVGGQARQRIARLHADGSLDINFNPNVSSDVYSLALQTDGRILAGGSFSTVNGVARKRIARLNPDGTLDTGFTPGADGSIRTLALLADGGILAGGAFSVMDRTARNRLARLYNELAECQLEAIGTTRLEWTRSGTAPEASRVLFELSVNDGHTWSLLGEGIRTDAGWELEGLDLPEECLVRGVAFVSDGGSGAGQVSSLLQLGATPYTTRIIRLTGDLVFGDVEVGGIATRTLTIHNDGNDTLTVHGITYPHAVYTGTWNGPIPPGDSESVTVSFNPTTAQSYIGDLSVQSDMTAGTHTYTCAGTGVHPPYTFTISGGKATITSYTGPGGDIVVPGTLGGFSVTAIASSAFLDHADLISVILPDGLSSVGNMAFSGCASLTSITLPDSVVSMGYGVFYGCASLHRVDVPNGVTRIGQSTFQGCSSLTSVTIPDSVTMIDQFAFRDCGQLTSIRIPDGVNHIRPSTFEGCANLATVHLGAGIQSIEREAFFGCAALLRITLPASVGSIGWYAFRDCVNLEAVYFEGNAPSGDDLDIFWDANDVIIYRRESATGWPMAGERWAWRPTALWTGDDPDFTQWLSDQDISGDPAVLFRQLCPVRGVAYGFRYAFGANLLPDRSLLIIRMVNGRPVVETPAQEDATRPYVDVRVVGTDDLTSGDWTLPITPAADTTGKPADADWHEPAGAPAEAMFFRLEAELQ